MTMTVLEQASDTWIYIGGGEGLCNVLLRDRCPVSNRIDWRFLRSVVANDDPLFLRSELRAIQSLTV